VCRKEKPAADGPAVEAREAPVVGMARTVLPDKGIRFAARMRRHELVSCPPRFHPARRVRFETTGARDARVREGAMAFRLPSIFPSRLLLRLRA